MKAVVEALRAEGSPDCSAKLFKTIRTGERKEVVIYRFSGLRIGDIEVTAYFAEKQTIDFMTLSCRSEKVCDAALPRIEER